MRIGWAVTRFGSTCANLTRFAKANCDFLFGMEDQIEILTVARDGRDGIIVTFSDGTTGGYVVEELLELRPKRAWTKPHLKSSSSQIG